MPDDYVQNQPLHRQPSGRVRWPDLKLPPINLYNAPRTDTMTHLHAEILEYLDGQHGHVTVATVAIGLKAAPRVVRAALHDLVDAGEVDMVTTRNGGERFALAVPPAA